MNDDFLDDESLEEQELLDVEPEEDELSEEEFLDELPPETNDDSYNAVSNAPSGVSQEKPVKKTSQEDSEKYHSTNNQNENKPPLEKKEEQSNENPSPNNGNKPKEDFTPDEVGPKRKSFQDYQAEQQRYNQEAEALRQRKQTNTETPEPRNATSDVSSDDSPKDDLKKDDEKKNDNSSSKAKDVKDHKDSKAGNNKQGANNTKPKANKNSKPAKKPKKKSKNEIKEKAVDFLKKHPMVIVAIVGFVFLIAFIMLLAILAMGDQDEEYESELDPTYDFSLTTVNVTNDYSSNSDKIVIETVSLMDFLEGAAYAQFGNSLSAKSDNEKIAIYESFFVAAKSVVLSMGGYDASTKEITIRSGLGGMPYCDVLQGCKVYKHNNVYSYVTASYNKKVNGTLVNTVGPLDSHELNMMDIAYANTKNKLLVPDSVNSAITKYDFARPQYNDTIKNKWVSSGKTEMHEIISATEEYKNFKIYDLTNYAMSYTYTDGDDSAYWWPIGSTSPTSGNIYGGTPSTVNVTSKFGPRVIQGVTDYHSGVDIASSTCEQNVIVATRSGKVIKAAGGCASQGSYGNTCNYGYGNYVKIDHGNGIVSVYAHMTKDSIVVKEGQTVSQGEKIGLMGSSGSSTGCHLHFGIEINGSATDPLQFINDSNTRPSGNVNASYKDGNSNMQSVCLTLKQSGFSNKAVAAIMTNIQAESSFRTDSLGDNGTSYGLCQWHNGRYAALKSYCGSEYSTVKCQMSYLIYELQKSYQGVYRMLLSNNTAHEMATYYCINFEVPANRYEGCPKRANNYANTMLTYVQNGCK